jgi:hypothetical protein
MRTFYVIDHCGKLYIFRTFTEAEAKREKFIKNGERDVTLIIVIERPTKDKE